MKPNITHITKVEARGLWGKYDIEWNPHPDVNILIGINGSGKTTLLKLIDSFIKCNDGVEASQIGLLIINFEDTRLTDFYWAAVYKNYDYKKTKLEDSHLDNESLNAIKNAIAIDEDFIYSFKSNFLPLPYKKSEKRISYTEFINHILINTFEYNFQSFDKRAITGAKGVKTQLDWELWLLEKEYISYQLTIGKRIEKVVFESAENNIKEKREEIYGKKNLFIETINRLFSQTHKTIDTDEKDNSIIFRQEDLTLTSYQLSSGEKQLLIILLKVLLQDNKHFILLMDEPEISLHIEWQHQLIDCIRALNENCQIIIATHSPSIFSKGWYDKIVRMEDITQPTKVAASTNDD